MTEREEEALSPGASSDPDSLQVPIQRWAFYLDVPAEVAADDVAYRALLQGHLEMRRVLARSQGWWCTDEPGSATVEMRPAWMIEWEEDGVGHARLVDEHEAFTMVADMDRQHPPWWRVLVSFRVVAETDLERMVAMTVAQGSGEDPAAIRAELEAKLTELCVAEPAAPVGEVHRG